jgi:hypothetical protein
MCLTFTGIVDSFKTFAVIELRGLALVIIDFSPLSA